MQSDIPELVPRVVRWEQRAEWPLTVLAVLFLLNYSLLVIDTEMSPTARTVCKAIDVTLWALFGVDYLVRIVVAHERRHYFVRHLHDLAMVVLPILRPLRVLRLLLLLRVLNRRGAASLHGRVVVYVVGSSVLLVYCAALAVLDAERGHPGSNIQSIGSALWWAAVTVTTVGYGDHYPVTTEGRYVAVGLMIGGIAIIGVVTATLASWLVDRVRATNQAEQAITQADLDRVLAELAAVRATLATIETRVTGQTPAI